MKPYIISLVILLAATQAYTQTLELRGTGGLHCSDNLYHITLQVRNDASATPLGAFSVYCTYDQESMEFQSFNSLGFDGSANCGGPGAWATPAHNNRPGALNLNFWLQYGMEGSSCPAVGNTWVDIAELVFQVSDFPEPQDMAIVPEYTHFNSAANNDGSTPFSISIQAFDINNCLGDYDGDGISDELDNCPFIANAGQQDANNNGVGDVCELDCDLSAYASDTLLICSGTSTTMGVSGIGGVPPYTFLWSNGDTLPFPTVSPTQSTTYYVTVTDAADCVAQDTVQVNVSDMMIGDGLIVIETGTWIKTDTIYNGDVVDFEDLPTSYMLRTLVSGEMESVAMILTGEFTHYRKDNTFKYEFVRRSNGSHWVADLVPGSYNMNLRAFTGEDTTGLSCAGRDIAFTITSDCMMDLGADTTICAGETLLLDAASSGTGPFSYAWETGEDTPSLSVSPTEDETYRVTVTDGTGCTAVDFIDVEVNSSGTVDAFHFINRNTGATHAVIADGDTYFLDDFPQSYNIEIIAPGVTGSVGIDLAGPVSDNHYSNILPHMLEENNVPVELPIGDYTLTVTAYDRDNGAGVSCSSLSRSFTIKSCPVVDMADEVVFCTAESSDSIRAITPSVTGNSGPYSYAWSDGTSQDHIVISRPTGTTTHYVSITNASPSCGVTVDSIIAHVSDIGITDVQVVDMDNSHNPVGELRDGGIYNVSDLPTNYSFEAFTTGTIGSVRFELEDDLNQYETDNGAPYRFRNDNQAQNLPAGNYTLTIRPHALADAEGPVCGERVIRFQIVDCAAAPIVAGTAYDVCGSYSAQVSGTNWVDVVDGQSALLASFQPLNGVDLGRVDVDVRRSADVNAPYVPAAGNLKLLPRHFHLRSELYPSGAVFPYPVKVRLYFTGAELQNMNASDKGKNGLTNYVAEELVVGHYYGSGSDCDPMNNAMDNSNYESLPTAYGGSACNGGYVEFITTHFSEFFIQEQEAALPMELISFTAKEAGGKVRLDWTTAMEEHVSHFEVERRHLSGEWREIGRTDARNAPSEYSLWDNAPHLGVNYYRLRNVDMDGEYEYSNMVAVDCADSGHDVVGDVYPNPVPSKGRFSVSVHLDRSAEAYVMLVSGLGQIYHAKVVRLEAGGNTLRFDSEGYLNGLYLLRIEIEGKVFVREVEVY